MAELVSRCCFWLRSWLFLLVLSFLAVSTGFVQYARSQSTVVSVFPSSIVANVGQSFSINVTISDVLDLYGWEFRLSWNPALIDAFNAAEGPFLKRSGETFFSYNINATAGRMVVDCTLLGMISGASGSGTLSTITFNVKGTGECPLDLYNIILLDSLEQLISCQAIDGYGLFSAGHDVAVIDVQASPVTVLPGSIVKANVTIQNQGGYPEGFNVIAYANSTIIDTQYICLNSGSSTTVPFNWDTTGFGKGEYTILALANSVPGETDVTDNSKIADGIFTVLYLGHDIAVVDVRPAKITVGEGYCMNIGIAVKNYGVFTETIDTTTYVNTTAIQTQTVTLTSGTSFQFSFTWNTTSFIKGNYTVKAYAWPVTGETNTADNTRVGGWVFESIAGDINCDRKVDLKDVFAVGKAYGSVPGNTKWVPECDLNSDLIVDLKDYFATCKNYGKTWQ